MSDNSSQSPPVEDIDTDDGEALARATLDRLIQESGEGYAAISRLIGRNAAYIQQYVKRAVPRRLSEEDRQRLACYFGVSEELLGAPPLLAPRISPASTQHDCVEIRRTRKPPGEHPRILVDRALLHGLGQSRESWLVAHRIDDDSMAPTLNEGDLVLIDTADFREHLRDGIYAIENGSRIFVKRLAVNPVSLRVTVLSDNAAYTSVAECEQSEVHIMGRVVWHSRII